MLVYDDDRYFATINFTPYDGLKPEKKEIRFSKIVKNIEKKLGAKGEIYIRDSETKGEYKLQIPTEYIFPVKKS